MDPRSRWAGILSDEVAGLIPKHADDDTSKWCGHPIVGSNLSCGLCGRAQWGLVVSAWVSVLGLAAIGLFVCTSTGWKALWLCLAVLATPIALLYTIKSLLWSPPGRSGERLSLATHGGRSARPRRIAVREARRALPPVPINYATYRRTFTVLFSAWAAGRGAGRTGRRWGDRREARLRGSASLITDGRSDSA